MIGFLPYPSYSPLTIFLWRPVRRNTKLEHGNSLPSSLNLVYYIGLLRILYVIWKMRVIRCNIGSRILLDLILAMFMVSIQRCIYFKGYAPSGIWG